MHVVGSRAHVRPAVVQKNEYSVNEKQRRRDDHRHLDENNRAESEYPPVAPNRDRHAGLTPEKVAQRGVTLNILRLG